MWNLTKLRYKATSYLSWESRFLTLFCNLWHEFSKEKKIWQRPSWKCHLTNPMTSVESKKLINFCRMMTFSGLGSKYPLEKWIEDNCIPWRLTQRPSFIPYYKVTFQHRWAVYSFLTFKHFLRGEPLVVLRSSAIVQWVDVQNTL